MKFLLNSDQQDFWIQALSLPRRIKAQTPDFVLENYSTLLYQEFLPSLPLTYILLNSTENISAHSCQLSASCYCLLFFHKYCASENNCMSSQTRFLIPHTWPYVTRNFIAVFHKPQDAGSQLRKENFISVHYEWGNFNPVEFVLLI